MRRTLFLAAMLLTALAPAVASAATAQSNLAITVTSTPGPSSDPTVGLLPSDRDAYANWQMAGLQSVGGIPNRTTVCATVKPIGGGSNDTTNIQNAINSCPAGEVVLLGLGTFTISEGSFVLVNKGITLRGSGPCAGTALSYPPYPATPQSYCTLIQRTGGASIGVQGGNGGSPHIILGPEQYNNYFSTVSNLAANAVAGTYTVQVVSTTGFAVGQIVALDEVAAPGWQTDWVYGGYVWAEPDYRIVWGAHNPTCEGGDQFCEGGSTAPSIPCWYGVECQQSTPSPAYISELKQIASIGAGPCPGTNCTVTFDSPITISYRVNHTAHLATYQTAFTIYAGIENMTLQNADTSNVTFRWCAYCWAKNVEDTIYSGGSIWIDISFRVQLEEVYDHMGAWPYTGGAGYNWQIDDGSSENLIWNSISILNDKVMVARAAGGGNVIAYNYFDMGFCADWGCGDQGGAGFDEIEDGPNGSHWWGSHHMLFEGNLTWATDSDDTWGSDPYHTWFRNYANGYRSRFIDYTQNTTVDDINNIPGGNGPLRAAALGKYVYWHSFIGNVLGTPGHTTGWTYTSDVCYTPAIFALGIGCAGGSSGDPEVLSQQPTATNCVSASGDQCPAIRNGNYDYLNNAIEWDPNNSDHNIPSSFFLSSKPAFFNVGGGYTWPWVTPTGSPQLQTGCGGTCSGLPAKARYDAGTAFTQP
jgi:hypothetical protein